MNPKVSEELKEVLKHLDAMRKKREQVLDAIRSNRNSFDDDLILCRCVVELTGEIERVDFSLSRRSALNDCGLLDDVIADK